MLKVNEQRVYIDETGRAIIDGNTLWQELMKTPPLSSVKDVELLWHCKSIYVDWVQAPASGKTDSYQKKFTNTNELAKALLSNVKMRPIRLKEEQLADHVLANFEIYEKECLDNILEKIGKTSWIISKKDKLNDTFYGPLPKQIDYRQPWTTILQGINKRAAIERLYIKVSMLHTFWAKVQKEAAANHRYRRTILDKKQRPEVKEKRDKWNLKESHTDVNIWRQEGRSLWGGISGSTGAIMDFVYYILNIKNTRLLADLAYCIVAFFHYMPTTRSCTHTCFEVLLAASSVVTDLKTADKGISMVVEDNKIPIEGPLVMQTKATRPQ